MDASIQCLTSIFLQWVTQFESRGRQGDNSGCESNQYNNTFYINITSIYIIIIILVLCYWLHFVTKQTCPIPNSGKIFILKTGEYQSWSFAKKQRINNNSSASTVSVFFSFFSRWEKKRIFVIICEKIFRNPQYYIISQNYIKKGFL